MDVTDDDFQQKVLSAVGLILVDFWAPWCEPCQGMSKQLDRLDEDITIVKVNVDECPTTKMACGVGALPTLVLFHNGQEKARLVGLQGLSTISQMIREVRPTSWDRISNEND